MVKHVKGKPQQVDDDDIPGIEWYREAKRLRAENERLREDAENERLRAIVEKFCKHWVEDYDWNGWDGFALLYIEACQVLESDSTPD